MLGYIEDNNFTRDLISSYLYHSYSSFMAPPGRYCYAERVISNVKSFM